MNGTMDNKQETEVNGCDPMDISSNTDTEDQFDDSLEMDEPPTEVLSASGFTLPERFRPKHHSRYKMTYTTIPAESSLEELTIGVVIQPQVDDNDDVTPLTHAQSAVERPDCTGDDVTQALTWIRHQLVALKQEDKNILERFYEIRAKMNKFRNNLYRSILPIHASANHSSASDPSINNNNQTEDYKYRASSLNEDCYLGQFRDRTVSMLPPRTDLTLLVPPDDGRRPRAHELL